MTAFLDSQGKSQVDPADVLAARVAQQGAEQGSGEISEAEAARRARFEAARNKMSDDYEAPDTDVLGVVLNATQAPGRGSAYTAAASLASVLDPESAQNKLTEGLDGRTMRAEEYTALKEARLRAQGAEILTVDPTYNPLAGNTDAEGNRLLGEVGAITATTRNAGAAALLLGPQAPVIDAPPPSQQQQQQGEGQEGSGGGEGGLGPDGQPYQPKVSTWGVFPRPNDISAAYGGGRNLKPGQALETEEQKAAREKAYREALSAYRAKAGLDIDPELEEQAEVLYNEGMVLFRAANLKEAYYKFDDAVKLVPLKSKYGGLAGLQKAVVLDSMGENEAAQKLYKQLQGHAVTSVSKKAKQLLFGFQASSFLKANTISYSARKGDFDRYFRGIVDRNKVYVATEEDRAADERAARVAAVIAVAVLLGPIGAVAALAARTGTLALPF